MIKRLLLFFCCLFIFFSSACILVSGSNKDTSLYAPTLAPTVTPKPSPRPSSTPDPSKWTLGFLTDAFGDITTVPYIFGEFGGQFSNTTTPRSSVTVYVLYYTDTKDTTPSFEFVLLENNTIKASFSSEKDVVFAYKIDDKEFYNVLSYDPFQGSLILFPSAPNHFTNGLSDETIETNYKEFYNALVNGKDVKCVIQDSKYASTYNFTIEGVGFNNATEMLELMASPTRH